MEMEVCDTSMPNIPANVQSVSRDPRQKQSRDKVRGGDPSRGGDMMREREALVHATFFRGELCKCVHLENLVCFYRVTRRISHSFLIPVSYIGPNIDDFDLTDLS